MLNKKQKYFAEQVMHQTLNAKVKFHYCVIKHLNVDGILSVCRGAKETVKFRQSHYPSLKRCCPFSEERFYRRMLNNLANTKVVKIGLADGPRPTTPA